MSQIRRGNDRPILTLTGPDGPASTSGSGAARRADDAGQRVIFFGSLARTADIETSCREAHMSVDAAWARYQQDPHFRGQWDMAVDRAYANLELRLLSMALGGVTSETVTETDADGVRRQTTRRDLPGFARQILQAHRQAVAGRVAIAAADAPAGSDGYATLVAMAAAMRARLDRSSAADDSR